MIKLKLATTTQFDKDVKLLKKRGKNLDKLFDVIDQLSQNIPLAPKHRDHFLSGKYSTFKECHIEPDWLLIYKVYKDELILVLSRTGTHSDLF